MIHIKSDQDYTSNISSGKSVVKYGAKWCYPCRQIEPLFDRLAQKYPYIKFLSVDVDLVDHEHTFVATVPTFKFFNEGKEQETLTFAGANGNKLETTLSTF